MISSLSRPFAMQCIWNKHLLTLNPIEGRFTGKHRESEKKKAKEKKHFMQISITKEKLLRYILYLVSSWAILNRYASPLLFTFTLEIFYFVFFFKKKDANYFNGHMNKWISILLLRFKVYYFLFFFLNFKWTFRWFYEPELWIPNFDGGIKISAPKIRDKSILMFNIWVEKWMDYLFLKVILIQ